MTLEHINGNHKWPYDKRETMIKAAMVGEGCIKFKKHNAEPKWSDNNVVTKQKVQPISYTESILMQIDMYTPMSNAFTHPCQFYDVNYYRTRPDIHTYQPCPKGCPCQVFTLKQGLPCQVPWAHMPNPLSQLFTQWQTSQTQVLKQVSCTHRLIPPKGAKSS